MAKRFEVGMTFTSWSEWEPSVKRTIVSRTDTTVKIRIQYYNDAYDEDVDIIVDADIVISPTGEEIAEGSFYGGSIKIYAGDFDTDDDYTPSATNGDYSPSCPWNAPGMSIRDFF